MSNIKLPDQHTLYLPTPTKEQSEATEKLIREISLISGGSTIYQGTGNWVDDLYSLVEEKITILEFSMQLTRENQTNLNNLVYDWAIETTQDSVAYKHNNIMYLAKVGQCEEFNISKQGGNSLKNLLLKMKNNYSKYLP